VKSSNIWIALAAGLATGMLCGMINGTLIGFLKLPPFIATLGTQSIIRGVALTATGGIPVMNLKSSEFLFIGSGNVGVIPFMSFIAVLGFLLTYFLLYWTKRGVYTYAIGGHEIAAKWAGIKVSLHTFLLYSYAGLLTGAAGIILAARVNSGQPFLASGIELQAIAATCIGGTSMMGGKGSLVGTLFGVVLIGILSNSLNLLEVSSFVQEIIIGFTIIIAVLTSLVKKES
jgi:ribose transport system permease protein